MKTSKEVIEFGKKNGAVMVDLKFIDFLGTWQHFGVPISDLTEEMIEEGRMFDGSSIRCWQTIDASDMKVVPDLSSAKMDPFFAQRPRKDLWLSSVRRVACQESRPDLSLCSVQWRTATGCSSAWPEGVCREPRSARE